MSALMTFSLILILHSIVSAQDNKYGIEFGINFNNSASHNITQTGAEVNFDSKRSYYFGFHFSRNFSRKFALALDLLFKSQRVSTVIQGPDDGPLDIAIKYNYLAFSPKVQYNYSNSLFINTGPSFDLVLKSKWEQYGNNFSRVDNIVGTKSMRLGLITKAGYILKINRFSIIPEFSYDFAITDTNPTFGEKISSIQFGFTFSL